MSVRDELREVLDVLDGIGVDPQMIRWARPGVASGPTICLDTCADFHAVCKALRVKDANSRLNSRAEMRVHEGSTDRLVVTHFCFPHLPCWTSRSAPS